MLLMTRSRTSLKQAVVLSPGSRMADLLIRRRASRAIATVLEHALRFSSLESEFDANGDILRWIRILRLRLLFCELAVIVLRWQRDGRASRTSLIPLVLASV